MDIDYPSLEKRYGTLLAQKIHEEIARADQKRFTFYKIPHDYKILDEYMDEEDEQNGAALPPRLCVEKLANRLKTPLKTTELIIL